MTYVPVQDHFPSLHSKDSRSTRAVSTLILPVIMPEAALGMTNSVDPGRTVLWVWLGLYCLFIHVYPNT